MIEYIFQICLEKKLNDHHYSDNRVLCQQTLRNCLAIFASNHEVVVFGNDIQHHANKGTQQTAIHRLSSDGGIAMYLKKTLDCTIRDDLSVVSDEYETLG